MIAKPYTLAKPYGYKEVGAPRYRVSVDLYIFRQLNGQAGFSKIPGTSRVEKLKETGCFCHIGDCTQPSEFPPAPDPHPDHDNQHLPVGSTVLFFGREYTIIALSRAADNTLFWDFDKGERRVISYSHEYTKDLEHQMEATRAQDENQWLPPYAP